MMNKFTRDEMHKMAESYKPFADERGLMSGMIEQLLADRERLCALVEELNDKTYLETVRVIEELRK